MTLVGQDDAREHVAPGPPPGDEFLSYFRWVPDTHRTHKGAGVPEPTCPNLADGKVPKNAVARMTLDGGSLGTEDVLREAVGARNPRRIEFKAAGAGGTHTQAMATAALYEVPITDRLVLEVWKEGDTQPAGRIVFKKGDVTLHATNDPLGFMEHLIADEDFELLYHPLENVTHVVRPTNLTQGTSRPCSCGSC